MIKYTYETPDDLGSETQIFNSKEEFFASKVGHFFKELLSDGRLSVTEKIVITASFPAIITIEIEGESEDENEERLL